ncbi:peptidoglycan bridge formation glycyltransferase FemA/FemB family protein [Algibacter mikhailovii]|uniref:peptidoglycan bridge formation glycyltransferase FemA/FemB family protein n=1 Tax=Algibacter mikhailovii TaxID=425498 RepID=UPI002494A4B8|nr:peptidoglycan bridge formation glycyltransferase FemA/FemB family protein [Algibacter mikhailovii]
MIEIITTKDKWSDLLAEFDTYDVYHTYDYHMITKSATERPILIKYTNNRTTIGIPLLLRNIKNTMYRDATSVYGYSGPLSKGVTEDFDNSRFVEILTQYFSKHDVISIFSRLNPFIPNQNKLLKNFGEILQSGKVVNIDLKLDKVIQRQNYHRRLKNHINKSRKSCTVIKSNSLDDIDIFMDIYNENMARVNAQKNYYFKREYFVKLLESKDFETEIYFARENTTKKIISGAMFFKTNSIIQYHLSGTRDEFLHLMPTKLLIDEMRLNAPGNTFKFLNLGGGLGASENDSLFKFKSSFSDDHHSFYIWKLITNKQAYDEVCKNNNTLNSDSTFFPLYRQNENV